MCLFQRNSVPLKKLDHCRWYTEIMLPHKMYDTSALLKQQCASNLNISQIHCTYTMLGCKGFPKANTLPIKEQRSK